MGIFFYSNSNLGRVYSLKNNIEIYVSFRDFTALNIGLLADWDDVRTFISKMNQNLILIYNHHPVALKK
jgi:hypothetical protein